MAPKLGPTSLQSLVQFLVANLVPLSLLLLAGSIASANLSSNNLYLAGLGLASCLALSVGAALFYSIRWPLIGLLGLALGAGLFAFSASNAKQQMLLASCDGETVTAQFVIQQLVEQEPNQQRLVVSTSDTALQHCFDQLPATLRLSYWHANEQAKPDLSIGDQITAAAKLRRPHGNRNPGGFDYVAWLWRKGIDATGYIKSVERVESAGSPNLRETLSHDIHRVLADHQAKPLVLALAIAERSQLDHQQWKQARETGLAHLLAISGLHLGLVAGAFLLFASVLGRLFPTELGTPGWALVLPALAATSLYAHLAGWPLSTQRAWLMLVVFSVAALVNWRPPRFYAWAIALVLCLLWQPLNMLDAGFYLSFTAVALLLWFANSAAGIRGKLWAAIKLQAVLLLGMLPLQLWFFGGFSLLALPLNLLLIPPFAMVILPALLLVCLGLLLGVNAAELGLVLVADGLVLFQSLIEYTHQLSEGQWFGWHTLGRPSPGVLTLLLCAVLLLMAPRGLSLRPLGVVALVAMSIGLAFPKQTLEAGEFRITAFDAGQGTAVLIQTQNHNLLYDTGAAWRSGNSAMRTMILPSLNALGVNHIDTVMVSHTDNDHSGGLEHLLMEYPNIEVIGGAAAPCQSHFHRDLDGVTIKGLWPHSGNNDSNDQSCVILLKSDYGKALFTGDISRKVERQLRLEGGFSADWLLVPHHGSKTSSSKAFINAVRPNTAVITSGYNNRYGLPVREVVERYSHTQLFNTGDAGAVTSHFGPGCSPCNRSEIETLRWWQ